MKKFFLLLLVFFLPIGLTACGSEETIDNQEPTDLVDPIDLEEPIDITDPVDIKEPIEPARQSNVDKIITKAIEASNELQSFSMEMDLKQTMTNGEEEIKMDSFISIDATMEPLAMHQKMTMNMDGMMDETEGLMEGPFSIEMYLTEEGFYMQNPVMDGWISLPAEDFEEYMSLSSLSQDPAAEIERLKKYSSDFTITEEKDSYHLTLALTGASLQEFLQESLSDIAPELEMDQEVLENSTFHQIEYLYIIDKKNYYPQSMTMLMDFDMIDNEETVRITQEISGIYLNYNNIDEIVIPDEVKGNVMTMPAFQ
ncbi:DUF6612 family protein [Anaerobacillus sp. MEB173]|uniref:DUF6612 family protein n=1 Tax=Anaerobacillus sp. MEB173 TaxID=3383345 RepID=UPI003F91A0BF